MKHGLAFHCYTSCSCQKEKRKLKDDDLDLDNKLADEVLAKEAEEDDVATEKRRRKSRGKKYFLL